MSPRFPLRRGNICAEVLSFEKCETAAVPSPLINQEHTLVNDLFVITVILTLEGCKIWNPLAFIRTSLPIETEVMIFFFLATDVPPLVSPVFLELPGLDGNLPLSLHVRADGCWLPGLRVRGRLQAPAARDPAADPGSGAAALPQGETGLK